MEILGMRTVQTDKTKAPDADHTLFEKWLPKPKIYKRFNQTNQITLYEGDCRDLLRSIPDESANLIITSPPYNIGKEYEKKLHLDQYIEQQREVIEQCVRVLDHRGSICWQIGNFVDRGSIIPLDMILYPIFSDLGLKLRNRIVWHFEHGLHCSRRFSGRYEVIIWFTKSDDYIFNLDPIRVPQKYPGKRHFKGPKAGQFSCNPKGKNPGDVWVIPNVKNNHVEKTIHPCQFPVELIERFVLSMTEQGGLVIDPFMGVGSTAIAAVRHKRRTADAETCSEYVETAKQRIHLETRGELKTRPLGKPVYQPDKSLKLATNPFTPPSNGGASK